MSNSMPWDEIAWCMMLKIADNVNAKEMEDLSHTQNVRKFLANMEGIRHACSFHLL